MKIHAGPSGREVISLQKVDSLLGLSSVREARKVSFEVRSKGLKDHYDKAQCN
jgi:hypothetical protein